MEVEVGAKQFVAGRKIAMAKKDFRKRKPHIV